MCGSKSSKFESIVPCIVRTVDAKAPRVCQKLILRGQKPCDVYSVTCEQ